MSDEESKNNNVNELIAILGQEFDLTAKEIADIFWLTLKRDEYNNIDNTPSVEETAKIKEIAESDEPKNLTLQQNPALSNHPTVSLDFKWIFDIFTRYLIPHLWYLQDSSYEDTSISPQSSRADSKKPSDENQPSSKTPEVTTPCAGVYSNNQSSFINNKTLPLRVSDAASIRKALELLRSLKPLMRSIDSDKRVVLDETKSVERTAAEGFFVPVLKPESERWLELALVVDESKSMLIWRSTILELKTLLEGSGFFRDVRTWGMVADENGEISFRPGIGKTANKQRSANHRELIEPNGRRLILIVSDCVAAIWRNNALNSILKDWTNTQPVAIIQMLPDRMWLRTGLSRGASVLLGSNRPLVANKELLIKELLLWKDIDLDSGIKVPVLTLEPEVAGNWSQMVARKSDVSASGFVFSGELKVNSKLDSQNKSPNPKNQINPQKRVEGFRKTASPMARKLASLLAAAPVITLPVVRLIQQTLLPDSQQIHVAEVFLGGLLKPLTEIEADTLPDAVQYDFMDDEIRGMLVDASPVKDSVDVLDAVSEYVAAELGKSVKDFVALLKAPAETDNEQIKPFAQVTTKVLKRLGGDYADFAEELEQVEGKSQTDTETPEIINSDKPEGHGRSDDRDSDLTIQTQPFEFETATLIVKNPGSSKIKYGINRSRRQAKSFQEDLGNGVLLEMVEIPGGTFLMGSPEDEPQRSDSEGPQHQVTVQPFFMGKFPITQVQYQAIMGENPSRFRGENKPVERVSWDNAVEFCAIISQRTGKTYRLPSEAEWEYACRAGTTTPFYFGETITTDLVNYNGIFTYGSALKGIYREKTTSVGIFLGNAFGLHDMHGNVFEWCLDNYERNYDETPRASIPWVNKSFNNYLRNNLRMLRGGSWSNGPGSCRCAYRGRDGRDYIFGSIGFRVVVASPSSY